MATSSKILARSIMAGIVSLLLIQVVPYGRTYTNPAIISEPSWDSSATRAIVKRACFDCHSNETIWPWYSQVAPVSWLVRYDVDEGRSELNFSDWKNGAREGERPDKIRKEITKGEMPPFVFKLAHPEARLSDAEKSQLIDGVNATTLRR
ncbi:MAG: heme-binding domain-containing protein [Desulfuromonadaceae bacterium]|nr:heme-binding domain-containing protein [Desulfuromonadaceae bacterium]MDD5106252.1 heme-binding domain-containing protein [Desulfuromonadaceae bacterium]